jgi:hypothetical protein
MRKASIVVAVVAGTVLALGLAGVAAADPPEIQVIPINLVNVPWGPTCNGEPVIQNVTGTRRVERFFDDGTLVREQRHVRGTGMITLPSTGVTLQYEADFTFTVDPIAQTGTITGQQAHVILPGGGGVILRNSGRLIEDLSQFPPQILDEAGIHDFFDPGGLDQVCAALGA